MASTNDKTTSLAILIKRKHIRCCSIQLDAAINQNVRIRRNLGQKNCVICWCSHPSALLHGRSFGIRLRVTIWNMDWFRITLFYTLNDNTRTDISSWCDCTNTKKNSQIALLFQDIWIPLFREFYVWSPNTKINAKPLLERCLISLSGPKTKLST